jgi:hypothetical protein
MSVQSGAVTAITLPASGQLYWGSNGIEILTSTLSRDLTLTNATTGTATVLVSESKLRFGELAAFPGTRSGDGKKIAFATHRPTILFGSAEELVLYVLDVASLKLDHIAVHKVTLVGDEYPSIRDIEFSPDGRAVAYVVGNSGGGAAFLATVPP